MSPTKNNAIDFALDFQGAVQRGLLHNPGAPGLVQAMVDKYDGYNVGGDIHFPDGTVAKWDDAENAFSFGSRS